MKKKITLTRLVRPAGMGSSGAQVMEGENGTIYFVKFMENGQALKVLSNEAICGAIAIELGLPCPQYDIVSIEPALLQESKSRGLIPASTTVGPHFGVVQVENAVPLASLADISSATNKDMFSLAVLFDAWTYNIDRNNNGNVLMAMTPMGLTFYLIDHGHCFNCQWDKDSILRLIKDNNATWMFEMSKQIVSKSELNEREKFIQSVSLVEISKVVDSIPPEWGLTAEEKDSVKKYLDERRPRLGDVVSANMALFPVLK